VEKTSDGSRKCGPEREKKDDEEKRKGVWVRPRKSGDHAMPIHAHHPPNSFLPVVACQERMMSCASLAEHAGRLGEQDPGLGRTSITPHTPANPVKIWRGKAAIFCDLRRVMRIGVCVSCAKLSTSFSSVVLFCRFGVGPAVCEFFVVRVRCVENSRFRRIFGKEKRKENEVTER